MTMPPRGQASLAGDTSYRQPFHCKSLILLLFTCEHDQDGPSRQADTVTGVPLSTIWYRYMMQIAVLSVGRCFLWGRKFALAR